MATKKHRHKRPLTLALGGALLAGCLAGCGAAAVSQGGSASPIGMASPPLTDMSSPSLYAIYKDDPTDSDVSYEECFKPYEPFGLTYDAAKKQLLYNVFSHCKTETPFCGDSCTK